MAGAVQTSCSCTEPRNADNVGNNSTDTPLDKSTDIGNTESQQVCGAETLQPLTPPTAALAGSSSASGKNFELTVSNKAGYMCHVHVVTNWPVPPEVPFAIFTHPDNSALFRDINRVGSRNVLTTAPGYKEVQVEQLSKIKVFWINYTYSTWMKVVEDSRDPECLHIKFELVKSDVLGKFNGTWKLQPVRDPSGHVIGCRGELHQDVLPKGVPSFMARVPVLGGALRGISVRALTCVLEDMNVALDKVVAGIAAGRSTEAVLRDLCGSVSEAAHANGAVTSFAFDPADSDDDDEAEQDESNMGAKSEVVSTAPSITAAGHGAVNVSATAVAGA